MTKIENYSDRHLIVDSIEILNSMSGNGVKTIRQTVSEIQAALSTQAEKTENYWNSIADDGIVTPVEKKIVKQNMAETEVEEPVLLETAKLSGITETDEAYSAYENAYRKLYAYIYRTLRLFDSMGTNTQLPDRKLFIAKFSAYYAARDALRNAIENGRDAAVEKKANDYTDKTVADLRETLTSTDWINLDVLSSGLKKDIQALVTESEKGFVTPEIINKIKEMYSVSDDGVYAYVQQMQDELAAYVVDLKREINSRISQGADEVDIKVQDLENDTWAALEVKENEILAAAGKSDEIASALSVQINRISALVAGYNAEAYMTASIGLVWLVTGEMFAYYEKDLTAAQKADFESRFFAVYKTVKVSDSGNITGAAEYQMTTTVTDTQKKTLVNFLEAAGKISSYITMSADQLLLNGTSIFSSGKLSSQYTDYAPAQNYADSQISTLSGSLGALARENLVEVSKLGKTVIDGGFIKTGLIDVGTIAASAGFITKLFSNEIQIGNKLYGNGSVGSFEMTKDGNLTCNKGKICAANLVLSGFEAGDIILKKCDDLIAKGDVTKSVFIQICGAGTVRAVCDYSCDGLLPIKIGKTHNGTVVYSFNDTKGGTGSLSYDILVEEGDSIFFMCTGLFNIRVAMSAVLSGICIKTNYSNGVLAYLGTTIYGNEAFAPCLCS